MTLLRACRAQGQEVFVAQHKVDSTIMVQLDQLRGFISAFTQSITWPLVRSSCGCSGPAGCATTASNTIEVKQRKFIRHLKVYSKACDNIWTRSGLPGITSHLFIRQQRVHVHQLVWFLHSMCARSVPNERLCAADNPHNTARLTVQCARETRTWQTDHRTIATGATLLQKNRSVANAQGTKQLLATYHYSTCRFRHENG